MEGERIALYSFNAAEDGRRSKGFVSRNLKVLVDESEQVEVDFGWPNVNVALEVSPFFTHGSRAKQERDARRRRLLAGVRWHVVEALDDDIASERAFARTITTLRALGAT